MQREMALAILAASIAVVSARPTFLELEGSASTVCPGEHITYLCTVGSAGLTWVMPNGRQQSLVWDISSDGSEDGFEWRLLSYGETCAGCFMSSLSFAAQEGTVACKNQTESEGVSQSVPLREAPSAPQFLLTADDIVQLNSLHFNVTVHWTLPPNDISRYVLSVEPPTSLPLSGIISSSHPDFNHRELTVVLEAGMLYSFTVRADNCNDNQQGVVSEELEVDILVPPRPSSCVAVPVYSHSSNHLAQLQLTWSRINSDLMDIAPGLSGAVTLYHVYLNPVDIGERLHHTMVSSDCRDECTLTLSGEGLRDSSYSVQVSAENLISTGGMQNCSNWELDTRNDLIAVEVASCASKIYCRFLSSFVGAALCEIAYGTDPTRKQLPLADKTEETGHSGETLVIALTHQLESSTLYYYNVTAKGESMNVTVLGEFRTASYCQSGDLGTLVEQGHHQCRLNEGAASIRNGMVCYTGTATGSLAYYICDDGYELNVLLEGAMNPRECDQGGQWSGTQPECTQKEFEASMSEDPQQLSSCGLGIGIAAALCCLVIAPLSAAVGAASACLVVRRRVRQKGRPLPEAPRLPEEVPDTYNPLYDYVSNENIGILSNQAYGQPNRLFQKIEEGEKLENEKKQENEMENEEKVDIEKPLAEEYIKPTPATLL